MKLLGSNLHLGTLSSSGAFTAFAYSKSCELTTDLELVEVASSSATSKSFKPVRDEWNISCKCLLSNDESSIVQAFINHTLVTVSFRDVSNSNSTHRQFSGKAYISQLSIGATINQMATFNIHLKGSGPLTYTTI